MIPRFRALVVVMVVLAGALPGAARAPAQPLAESELTIVSGEARHRFRVELAMTPEARARGLMYRRSLASDAGMLFDFVDAQFVSFWMKNTLIPLDMLFIDSDGRIVNIAERTIPHSLAGRSSDAPVRAVLEINGGLSNRLGIRPGDRVDHPIFNGKD